MLHYAFSFEQTQLEAPIQECRTYYHSVSWNESRRNEQSTAEHMRLKTKPKIQIWFSSFWELAIQFWTPARPRLPPTPFFFFFCETHPPPCISHLPSYWIANQSPENSFTRSRSIQWIFHTRSYACCRAFLTLTPPLCRFFRGKPPVQIEHQIYSFPLPPSVPLT